LNQISGKGEVLANRFEILSFFKSTELTQTYFALDRQTQKKVIVKCNNCCDGKDRDSKIRFERLMIEAQTLKALNHPSIVRYVHSWGNQSNFFLVTEFVDSRSMKETYYQKKLPSRDIVIEYIIELLEVAEYLHFLGVVHRDIKPSNIMLSENIVLIDFNGSESKHVTFQHDKVVIGTPGYQCPESFKGVISPQSDIYSVGATLLFLLTGENPSGDLSRFKSLSTERDLLEVAFRAMNPNPTFRFKTAFEMKKNLLGLFNRQPMLIFKNSFIPITKEHFTIGRGINADYRILDENEFVSPIHSEISYNNDRFFISNKSINGTHVYRRNTYQKIENWELTDGDAIILCYTQEKGPYKILKYRKASN
jgi:serine/threonine protein kinase